MMRSKTTPLTLVLALPLLFGLTYFTACQSTEKPVALDDVPADITAAAQDALPGFVVEEAEMETENGMVIYSLEGTANGREYEVEIDAESGEVLEIEEDDDDDDDDDNDDDDDDDDDDD